MHLLIFIFVILYFFVTNLHKQLPIISSSYTYERRAFNSEIKLFFIPFYLWLVAPAVSTAINKAAAISVGPALFWLPGMYIYIYSIYRYTFLTVRIVPGQRWDACARGRCGGASRSQ